MGKRKKNIEVGTWGRRKEEFDKGQEYDLKSEEDFVFGLKKGAEIEEKASKMHHLGWIDERSGEIAEERRKMGGKKREKMKKKKMREERDKPRCERGCGKNKKEKFFLPENPQKRKIIIKKMLRNNTYTKFIHHRSNVDT